MAKNNERHFDVKSGLKRVLGRELITNDEVAIFELVKNSFDAKAKRVFLFFGDNRIVIADNGDGMSNEEITKNWLSVAYSSKRNASGNFRDMAADRTHFAGSKGIGRFSSDRLGAKLTLQTRPKSNKTGIVHKVSIDWEKFEENDFQRFEEIPVIYEKVTTFGLPKELRTFQKSLRNGTVLEIGELRQEWKRESLRRLKSALSKLINPFGEETDKFSISIVAPAEQVEDNIALDKARQRGEEPTAREIVNGKVGNFIFSDLQKKTTYISVRIERNCIHSTLHDRGELIYSIREPNKYGMLKTSGLRCDIFYLNQSAKMTFARRVGLPSVQFGSVFLFRNGFRVFPVGEDRDDWFGFNRRKQQGHSRFLGPREVIGRVDVTGNEQQFQEASSRNQGLIDTPAVDELKRFVMDMCLKRLERYVVPVSWVDKAESETDDLSRLMTDRGKARVSAAVASLVDNDEIELLDYSRRLVSLLNERSDQFEGSIASLKSIAEKLSDKALILKVSQAERRFTELKRSEAEARRVADEERETARAAVVRAKTAEIVAMKAQAEVETEKRRSHFLEQIVDLDAATILNLHHQVTIYSVNAAQQIENFLTETAGQETLSREIVLRAMEQIAYLNAKIYAVARFAARATFKLDSEKISTDLVAFLSDYISEVAVHFSSARVRIQVQNEHPGLETTFNPIDVSIIVDNMISNATKAKASQVLFKMESGGTNSLLLTVTDNGKGISESADKERIFEMGYTTTRGSGLGLYHVRQMLGQIGGSVEFVEPDGQKGTKFVLKIVPRKEKT